MTVFSSDNMAASPTFTAAIVGTISLIAAWIETKPKDAVKAIKKRLGNTKNYKSILYTLTLTEACVKNCGKRFHLLISTKNFLNDMTKILTPMGPKADKCPQVVQEKILLLIQSWADAFRNVPNLQHVVVCYESLKAEGFEFPAQDLDTFAPNLHTLKGELLRINDDLNNVFLRYDRFERPYKERIGGQDAAEQKTSQSTAPTTAAKDNAFPASAKTEETTQQPLIDFNDITPELRANEFTKARTAEDDDFDMFAQSRSSSFEASRISGSTYDDNSSGVPLESSIASAMNSKGSYPKLPSPVLEKAQEEKSIDEDIEDVEEWLKNTDLRNLEPHLGAEPKVNVTRAQDSSQVSSDEFDRFLSERSTLGTQRSSLTHSSGAVPRQMDMMAGEKREDPYAL